MHVLVGLGPSEWAYPAIAAALVIASFFFLTRPFVTLNLTLAYLVVANNAIYVLDYWSSAVASLLILNCLAGILLTSRPERYRLRSLLPALLVCCLGASSAAYGLARGNPGAFVIGDFYHLVEVAALFVLARSLVSTGRQIRTVVCVLIGATIVTSLLQTIDAFAQASYLPGLEDIYTKRIINMFAPIAFVLLLAVSASTQWRIWIVAGLFVVDAYIVLSFVRGLWLATAVSTFVLLVLLRAQLRPRALKLTCASAVMAGVFVFTFNLGPVVAHRITKTVAQLSYIPTEPRASATVSERVRTRSIPPSSPSDVRDAPLSSRRVLEHVLLFHEIAQRPLLGQGLGATYTIAGSAVMGGPRGKPIHIHYVHDLYLAIAFRSGLPALAVFLSMLSIYFVRAIGRLQSAPLSNEDAALAAGLVAVVFGQAVLSLTSPVFLNHPTGGVIACMMAMTLTTLPLGLHEHSGP